MNAREMQRIEKIDYLPGIYDTPADVLYPINREEVQIEMMKRTNQVS